MSLPLLFLRASTLVWAVVVCPLAALLLLTCVTLQGAVFAIGALLLGVAPALAWLRPGPQWIRPSGLLAFGLWFLIFLGLVFASPNGSSRPEARVQNRYSNGNWHYQ